MDLKTTMRGIKVEMEKYTPEYFAIRAGRDGGCSILWCVWQKSR